MNKILFRILSYLQYYWNARTDMYIHSSFIFQWYQHIQQDIEASDSEKITIYREKLHRHQGNIYLAESQSTIAISERYRQTSISPFYGKVLYQTARYLHARNFLELGTSLGVSTLYLATSSVDICGVSIDRSQSSLDVITLADDAHYFQKIKFICDDFRSALPRIIDTSDNFDLVYIDGDHSYQSTIDNIDKIIPHLTPNAAIILDDIRWSRDMYRAWKQVQSYPIFMYTIDFGRIGILFTHSHTTEKQDFILK